MEYPGNSQQVLFIYLQRVTYVNPLSLCGRGGLDNTKTAVAGFQDYNLTHVLETNLKTKYFTEQLCQRDLLKTENISIRVISICGGSTEFMLKWEHHATKRRYAILRESIWRIIVVQSVKQTRSCTHVWKCTLIDRFGYGNVDWQLGTWKMWGIRRKFNTSLRHFIHQYPWIGECIRRYQCRPVILKREWKSLLCMQSRRKMREIDDMDMVRYEWQRHKGDYYNGGAEPRVRLRAIARSRTLKLFLPIELGQYMNQITVSVPDCLLILDTSLTKRYIRAERKFIVLRYILL